MRPQDVRNLRTCDLDRHGEVWVHTPWTHKTEHHGHVRRIAIGPKAWATHTSREAIWRFFNALTERRDGVKQQCLLDAKRDAHVTRELAERFGV